MKKTILFFFLSFIFSYSFNAQDNFLDMTGAGNQFVLSDCTFPISGNSSITMEFLMRKEDSANNWLLGYGIPASSSGSRYHLSTGGSELFILYPSIQESTGYHIPVNEWHHYAFVYDGTTGSVYVDGNLIYSNSSLPSQNVPANHLVLGHVSTGGAGINGQVDEVRLWNIARSQEDIQGSMSGSLTGNEAGLLAYYNFNQGNCGGNNTGLSAPQVTDITGNGCGANLNGFALNGCTSNFVCVDTCGFPPPPQPVPTMGEWALIIFALMIMSMGVVTVMRWQKQQELVIG